MINVVIPMAGEGLRFVEAGYKTPKPFIRVLGKTLVETVLDNLAIPDAHYILIAQKEHLDQQVSTVTAIETKYNVTFLTLDGLTEGAAVTGLSAHRIINNDAPLLMANSDQFVDADITCFVNDANDRELDGSILTFIDPEKNTKWSFVRLDESDLVVEVREKVAISNLATVGIYYFRKGCDFVDATIDMIVKNDRVNNEFYTCPVYNYMIASGKKVGVYNIKSEQMHGLGVPEDLNAYIARFS